jgi:hypothetical protein
MDNYSVFDLQKSLDTSSNNNNNVLDAILLSKVISQYIRTQPVLWNVIKHVPWTDSNIYSWDAITNDTTSYSVTDGGTITASDPTFLNQFVKHSYFYNLGYVTNPAQQAASALVDAMELRLSAGSRSLLRTINQALFAGDSNNSTYPGLKAQLTVSSTFSVAGSGAAVSHALLDNMLMHQIAAGYDARNMVFVVSPNVYKYMKSAAFNNVRIIGINDNAVIGFALAPYQSSLEYSGVPVIMDPFAGGALAADSNDNIYLLSIAPEDICIPVGQDVTVEMNLLAPANQDSKPVRIKTYHSLALRNSLSGVLASNVSIPGTAFA